MFYILSVIQISHINSATLMSNISQLIASYSNIPFGYSNKLNDLDLLVLNASILSLQLVQLPYENINLLSILRYLVQAIILKLLLLELNLFILLSKVSKLILQSMIVSLSAFEFIDFGCQFLYKQVLVSGDWWRAHDNFYWLQRWWMSKSVP